MKNRKFYAIQQAERVADLYIFGDIVPFALFDGDVSAHSIEQQIKDLDVDEIRVHIDSYGGSVSEGWAIYNALRQHPAKVVSYGDGFVASKLTFSPDGLLLEAWNDSGDKVFEKTTEI